MQNELDKGLAELQRAAAKPENKAIEHELFHTVAGRTRVVLAFMGKAAKDEAAFSKGKDYTSVDVVICEAVTAQIIAGLPGKYTKAGQTHHTHEVMFHDACW